MTERNVTVYTEVYEGFPYFIMGANFCARCSLCKVALTKYCFTKEEAQREGDAGLAEHECKGRR